jgi:2'-5' RNA ligase
MADEPNYSGSSMVALYPPADLAGVLAVSGGLPPEKLHVTIAYTGDASTVPVDALRDAVTAAAERGPITTQVAGHARFTGGDQDVVVALIDSPDLEDLRREVLAALDHAGIQVPREHGFTAHMTLTYLDPDAPDPVGRLDARPVEFRELVAVHGDDQYPVPFQPPSLAALAGEAYTTGWAASGGPLTDRIRAGYTTAVAWAVEHADDPNVLETTLHLGHLDGVWAAVMERRLKAHADNERTLGAAWRRLARRLPVPEMVRRYRNQLGLREATADDDERRAEAIATARWLLAHLADDPDYPTLARLAHDAIARARAEGTADALTIAADQLERIGFDYSVAFEDAYRRLEDLDSLHGEADNWLGLMLDNTSSDLGSLLASMARDEAGYDEMVSAAAGLLDSEDARGITTAIDLLTSRALSAGAVDLYGREGIQYVDFLTAGDGRVCFPAGTPVTTPDGPVPVDQLHVGDLVRTPQGVRRVTARFARPYAGVVAVLRAGGTVVAATAEHPFWTPDGWKSASDLDLGDLLKTPEEELVKVDGIIHVHLRQSDDVPAVGSESSVSACIPFGAAGVPVGTVHFQDDSQAREREVDGPATDRELLFERDAESLERLSHTGLQPVLASEAAVASERAELPLRQLARNDPPLLAAMPARDDNRRPAAEFRTVMPFQTLLGAETCPTSDAVDVLGVPASTSDRAGDVPMRDRPGHGEVLTTNRAGLENCVGPAGQVARSGAEGPSAVAGPGVEPVAALRTGSQWDVGTLGEAVAPSGAENASLRNAGVTREFFAALMAVEGERHAGPFRSAISIDCGPIEVYDITVEEEHVFYADGVLVHNCAICDNNESKNPWPLSDAPIPGVHPGCRCALAAAVPLGLSAIEPYLPPQTDTDT